MGQSRIFSLQYCFKKSLIWKEDLHFLEFMITYFAWFFRMEKQSLKNVLMQSISRQIFQKTLSVMVCSHNMRESVCVCRKLES